MLKSSINSAITHELFASATNAAEKGQAQYFTPPALARAIAEPLTPWRPVLCDLQCGHGALLAGARTHETRWILGADIDTPRLADESGRALGRSLIQCDATILYPLLREVDWRADLMVLNPPWGLRWHRDRLGDLAQSRLPSVRQAFAALDGLGRDTIDSTAATLLIALDLLSDLGEGCLIGNAATLDRLLFADGAPHRHLVRHLWRVEQVQASNVEALDWPPATALYFSPGWTFGPAAPSQPLAPTHGANSGPPPRRAIVRQFNALPADITVGKWQAVAQRVKEMARPGPAYNLRLADGAIAVHLSTFHQHSRKVDKALAKRLAELHGKKPMQVIMQRSARHFLQQSVGLDEAIPSPWSVDPALRDAVAAALLDYNANRAPLRPLGKIQRIGWLDEQDVIRCAADLYLDEALSTSNPRPQTSNSPEPIFRAGGVYPITSGTVEVSRRSTKPSIHGEDEELELRGQELALFIATGPEKGAPSYCFMDVRLLKDGTEVAGQPARHYAHFSLQQLAERFHIPEVPDMAALFPERHAHYHAQLRDIETYLTTS